ncbi:DUF6602 domain-containing protein [Erwinia papayae]|uniref:DUF6602 domain-containing protein n=1 Tax=Erwinia papayae TaxID=206499 RepID=A0ABV3N226_9GAMM
MSENQDRRKRKTVAQKKERADFAEREARTKEWISGQATRASKLRSKDKEFHGLEREFMYLQNKMQQDFEISRDIKHPRDVGTVREELLRALFTDNKLLPLSYGISKSSVRAASTSGHLSNEIDILFYDAFNSFTLMQRQDIYEVLPVEYCYGAIQVKSKLTTKELNSAFKNIASFKRLKRSGVENNSIINSGRDIQNDGFGIIFSYDTDMDWADIVLELKKQAANCDKNLLPNAIFILSKGFFLYGDERFASAYNSDIKNFENIIVYGNPDRQGCCLYQLYDIVFSLLDSTKSQKALPSQYYRLPLTAGDYSYEYSFGHFVEFGHCEAHGDYARTFTPEKLEKLISWCEKAEPINWVKATDIAYGNAGDNDETYKRQPGSVIIYNPEDLPLSDILVADKKMIVDGNEILTKVLAYDSIKSSGMNILIPYYYQFTEMLIQHCPKCKKAEQTADSVNEE